MTYWKCPRCAGEKETKDDIVLAICPCCQITMEKYFPPPKKNPVVTKGGTY
jgi:hypothetical protein